MIRVKTWLAGTERRRELTAPGRDSLNGQNGIKVGVKRFDPGVSNVSIGIPVRWAWKSQLG